MNSVLLFSVSDIGNDLLRWVENKGEFLTTFLPYSPFRRIIDHIYEIPYVRQINWFLPIEEAVLLLMYWGTAIGIYYAYMIILRWVKAIE